MSLWRRERVRVVLTPEQTLVLRPSLARTAAPQSQSLDPVETPQAYQALAACLALPQWRAAGVDIVLSNRWVCYALSEAPGAILRGTEERALAQARICAVYGGQAQDWRISVQSQPPDAGVFAAAIASQRMVNLLAALERAAVSRYTLRPLLDVAARSMATSLRAGWWVVVEPGWWCVLKASRGAWRHVSCQPCGDDWAARLAAHLQRSQLLAGEPSAPAQIWVQPIGCEATERLTYPAGWAGRLVLPAKSRMWDWAQI